jgi:predicted CXXCH cytochrome family protein
MKLSSKRFRFENSNYQRPNLQWRCGRAAAWGKPCTRGPKGDGSCGGVTACKPFFDQKTSRWACRRPLTAGGPCSEGPGPNGHCAHPRPPCVPRRTLRRIRSRLALLAVLLVIAGIGATLEYGTGAGNPGNSLSAGPLSSEHARYIGNDCAACHVPHDGGMETWASAVLVRNDMTSACLDCHTFAGEERNAHNFSKISSNNLAPEQSTQTLCITCHTEHNGSEADLVTLSDAQCSSCHQVTMENFADHSAFDLQFPSWRRTSLRFDHVSHLGKYFLQAGADDPTGCVDCHVAQRADVAVPVRGFEETCASCHAGDINDRALTILSLPEMSAEQFVALDQAYLSKVCPSRGSRDFYQSLILARQAVAAGDPFGDFESIAYGEGMGPVMQWSMASDSADIYDLPVDDVTVDDLSWLFLDLADSGTSPLADLLDDRAAGAVKGSVLLAGLSDALVRQAVCAWTSNAEVRQDPPFGGGWYIDGLSLNYMPNGHADPVMRSWLDLAVAAPLLATEHDEEDGQALIMRDTLINPKRGAGACAGCHGVSAENGDGDAPDALVAIDWRAKDSPWSPYLNYSHGPHLNLLGEGTACVQCHRLKDESGLADAFETLNPVQPASSFMPIGKDQCMACHGAEDGLQAVASDRGCLLCHDYHLDSGFSHQMVDMQQLRE